MAVITVINISRLGDAQIVMDMQAFEPGAEFSHHIDMRGIAGVVPAVPAETVKGIGDMGHHRVDMGKRLQIFKTDLYILIFCVAAQLRKQVQTLVAYRWSCVAHRDVHDQLVHGDAVAGVDDPL